MSRVLGFLTRTPEGLWLAEFPDLPGCEARASSIAQLRERARDAALAALRERRARGEPQPEFTSWEKLALHPLARGAMVLGVDLT
jgi:predicted RNase H-like HicB family nuclease